MAPVPRFEETTLAAIDLRGRLQSTTGMVPARGGLSRTVGRRLSALAVAVAASLGPAGASPARAGEGADMEAPERELVRKWFEKGALHHKLGEYGEAAAAYKEAYRLSREPVYLYNLAVAYSAAGNAAEAVRYFELHLAEAPDSPLRAEVEALLPELRKRAAAAGTVAGAPSAPEAAAAGPAVVPPPPGADPSPARRGRGLAIGLGVSAAIVVAGAVVTGLVLALRPTELDRLADGYPGVYVDFRP